MTEARPSAPRGASRTVYTLRNFASSVLGQMLAVVLQFVVRTVFINTLGKSYLGISGLFTNILSMLALAEMGVGSAIVFKLYDPIARDDRPRIAVLMKFYRTVYGFIGLAIAVVGVSLIPFLPAVIRDYAKLQALNINATVVFLLFLLDSVSSYLFFAYKSAIIAANQKEYLINVVGYLFTTAFSLVQIACLVCFRSFILFTVVNVAKTIGQNFAVAKMADRMYPYVGAPGAGRLSKPETLGIFRDCGALFVYKINYVVVMATGNVVLSAAIGLDAVAQYSNYCVLYAALRAMLEKVYNSVGHGIGNLHAMHDLRKEYAVFRVAMFVTAILGGTLLAGVFSVADEFVAAWIGGPWVIPQPFSLLLGLVLFTTAFKLAIGRYRIAYGLFKQGWLRPVFGIVVNLVVCVALVRRLGILSIMVGTLAADWLTFMWYDPLILHRIGFQRAFPVRAYYWTVARHFAVCCAVAAIDRWICGRVFAGHGWFSVVAHAAFCGLSVPLALMALHCRSEEGRYVLRLAGGQLARLRSHSSDR
jgi:O-antigen/teichoic acid export membrane protein